MIFQIENKNIHASDAGQGIDPQKETIVFLHGSGLSHIVWSLSEQFFSNKNFNEMKQSDDSQFKLFEKVDEKLILPQILEILEKLSIGDEGNNIKIGEKYFFVKLLSFEEEYQKKLEDVYEDVVATLTKLEIENFIITNDVKNLDSYSTNQIFFSNSFNFLENIPDQYSFINFNQSSGEIKKDNFLFQFNVQNIFKEDLPLDFKEKFLNSFSNYKKNIKK